MSAQTQVRMGGLPTFFVIGAPKAGTTSLHHYLDQHPQIQMSSVKEPGFFATTDSDPNDARKVKSRTKYESLFDPAIAVRGEASPSYAMYPLRQGVPERIKELVPDAKLVYLVRDPVERSVSHYHQLVATRGETRPLRDVLGDRTDPSYSCVCASLYAMQLELYIQSFSRDRIIVIDQSELRANRDATLSRIFEFLGVDATFRSSEFDVELLKSDGRRVYPPALSRFVGLNLRPNSRWLPPRVRRSLRQTVEKLFFSPLEVATLDDDSRAHLEALYAEDVERLRSITGQAFPTWSV